MRFRTSVFILFCFHDEKVFWESIHFDLEYVARQAGRRADALQDAR
jgi:hypothetical protein